MLDRHNVRVAGVQESGGVPVRLQILFLDFEAHDVRIPVASLNVIDRNREAPALGMPLGHSLKKIGCERGDAAFSWQVIAEKRDGLMTGV
jgi:hypothetical protein